MKKVYTVSIIVLQLFVGSAAILSLISYFSPSEGTMSPVICVLLAILGMTTGIRNIWKLIEK